MQSARQAGETGTHPARATTLRIARAPRVALSVLGFCLLFAAAPAAGANPFANVEILVMSGRNGVGFEMAQGVAIDPRRGELAVANSALGRIEIFQADGKSLAFFEHDVRQADGSYAPGQPHFLCYDAAGRLFVSDNLDPCVDVLDFRGRVIERLCLPSAAPGESPADTTAGAIARLRDGSMLVANRGERGRIHRFDARGHRAGAWGTAGAAPGELSKITALAEAPNGEIVVVCSGTELVVQRFEAAGRFVAGFGQHEIGPGNFSYPSGLAITDDGRIWVSDELRQCVQIFDATGTYLGMAGQGGPDPGSFLFPSSLATDGHSRLAVIERVGARLQLFRIVDAQNAFRVPEGR
jgi:hypothetical protein